MSEKPKVSKAKKAKLPLDETAVVKKPRKRKPAAKKSKKLTIEEPAAENLEKDSVAFRLVMNYLKYTYHAGDLPPIVFVRIMAILGGIEDASRNHFCDSCSGKPEGEYYADGHEAWCLRNLSREEEDSGPNPDAN